MDRLAMNISGMSCGHCVRAVTKALQSIEGVSVEQVGVGRATVSYDPGATSRAGIARVLEGEGYRAVPAAAE